MNHARTALSIALSLAFAAMATGTVRAEEVDEEVAQLIKPQSSLRLGVGVVNAENRRFGQYTGLNEDAADLLIDANLVRRDDATGTWMRFTTRNLGLDSRELRFEHEEQGKWGYSIEYNAMPRFEPLKVNTRLSGVGTNAQTVDGLSIAQPLELSMERENIGLGINRYFSKELELRLSFKNEEKDGSRMWGSQALGGAPTTNRFPVFMTEPINWRSQQWEAILNYSGEKFQLTGGYYGSHFQNSNEFLNLTILGTNTLSHPQTSLPPDNWAHQLYLTGGYNFTPTTRGTFKLSYNHSTQDERFFTPSAASGALLTTRTDLDGEVNTTLIQAGISSRPTSKLSLSANVRYEDRDDKTPRSQYITATGTRDGFNMPFSRTSVQGKAEASYRLPMDFRVTGGLDYENKKRSATTVIRQTSWRDENDEWGYRLELRRNLSEVLNGAVSYVSSKRRGSDYLASSQPPDAIDPVLWADRDRQKVRFNLGWTPTEKLGIQFNMDEGRDEYPQRLGPETGRMRLYSVDASYNVSDNWQLVGWLSQEEVRTQQSTIASTLEQWRARLRTEGNAFGFGVRGKVGSKVALGADLQRTMDRHEYRLDASTGDLPDISYDNLSLKLFGTYAVSRNSGVKLEYSYDRWNINDWTWNGPFYASGTTVSLEPNDSAHFLGLSGYYTFQ